MEKIFSRFEQGFFPVNFPGFGDFAKCKPGNFLAGCVRTGNFPGLNRGKKNGAVVSKIKQRPYFLSSKKIDNPPLIVVKNAH